VENGLDGGRHGEGFRTLQNSTKRIRSMEAQASRPY